MSWIRKISSLEAIDFTNEKKYDIKIICRSITMTFPRLCIHIDTVFEKLITQDHTLTLDEDPSLVNLALNWMCRSERDRREYLKKLSSSNLMNLARFGFKYLPDLKDECLSSVSDNILTTSDMPDLIKIYLETKSDIKALAAKWYDTAGEIDEDDLKNYPQAFWHVLIENEMCSNFVLEYCHDIPQEYLEEYATRFTLDNLKGTNYFTNVENQYVDEISRLILLNLFDKNL